MLLWYLGHSGGNDEHDQVEEEECACGTWVTVAAMMSMTRWRRKNAPVVPG